MTDRKVVGAAAAGAAALAIGLAVAAVARADDASNGATASATATTTHPGAGNGKADGHGWGPGGRFGGGVARGGDLSSLATTLGVDESRMREAIKGARGDVRTAHPPAAGTPSDQRDARLDAFADALARRLGIDAAKVRAALDETRAAHQTERQQAFDDRLSQAVKGGTLTQAEADAVRKAAKAGVIGMGRGPH